MFHPLRFKRIPRKFQQLGLNEVEILFHLSQSFFLIALPLTCHQPFCGLKTALYVGVAVMLRDESVCAARRPPQPSQMLVLSPPPPQTISILKSSGCSTPQSRHGAAPLKAGHNGGRYVPNGIPPFLLPYSRPFC